MRARGEVRVFDPLLVELHVFGIAPFVRERFYFEPDVTVYQPPVVVLEASLGILARFP
jgi:hypothetical protein